MVSCVHEMLCSLTGIEEENEWQTAKPRRTQQRKQQANGNPEQQLQQDEPLPDGVPCLASSDAVPSPRRPSNSDGMCMHCKEGNHKCAAVPCPCFAASYPTQPACLRCALCLH